VNAAPRLGLALILVGLTRTCTGCGVPPPPAETSVELGTGEWQFEPLANGQNVALVWGPQGGYHVWLSVQTQGMEPAQVTLRIEYEPMDTPSVPVSSQVRVKLKTTGEEQYLLGWPAQLLDPLLWVGHAVRFRVTLTDHRGVHGSDERTIKLQLPVTISSSYR
jgi:hypothetical protein